MLFHIALVDDLGSKTWEDAGVTDAGFLAGLGRCLHSVTEHVPRCPSSRLVAALPEVARAAGVAGYQICPEGVVWAELKAARAAGAQLLMQGAAHYPDILNDLADAPPFLWALGDTSLLTRPMVSLVGARNASSLGTRRHIPKSIIFT